jgi:sulfoquinovosidase
MRRRLVLGIVMVVVAVIPTIGRAAGGAPPATFVTGPLVTKVTLDPFSLTVEQAGRPVLRTAGGGLGFALGARVAAQTPTAGYGIFVDPAPVRFHATRAERLGANRYRVHTNDPVGRTFTMTVAAAADGVVRIEATLDRAAGVLSVGAAFARDPGERFLGFGERSEGADKTGEVVEDWAEEGPFSAGMFRPLTDPLLGEDWQGPGTFNRSTNYPVPWFLSTKGYGFLLDSTFLNRFDLRDGASWRVDTAEHAIRFDVVAGPTPAAVLDRYTTRVGRQPHPAPWFFGPWYQSTGADAPAVMAGWRQRDIPMTVAQTYTHYLPCAAQAGRRDDIRAAVDEFHRNGFKVTTYVNSFVCQDHPQGAYDEGDRNGWFVKTALGTTYPIPYLAYLDTPWSAVVDFTAPGATGFWHRLIAQALEDGYDGWMEDFGEYIPPDARLADGSTGLEHHNRYCDVYHAASHALTWPRRGPDFAQFVRCGGTYTARSARIVWGGDPTEDDSEADGLAASVNQGLSMGLTGVAYWGTDAGGFHALFTKDRVSADVFSRWIEVSAFNGIMRDQENGYPRPIFPGPSERLHVWSPELIDTYAMYARLRTQLYPYVWQAAMAYQQTGMPMMRHLHLVWPSEPAVFSPAAHHEFLFGPDLLIAPVVDEGARGRDVWLPPGEWIDFWAATAYDPTSGEFRTDGPQTVVSGGRSVAVAAPLGRLPIFVRAGACIPALPADVDTLADIGDAPGLVTLADAAGRERTLDYGGC